MILLSEGGGNMNELALCFAKTLCELLFLLLILKPRLQDFRMSGIAGALVFSAATISARFALYSLYTRYLDPYFPMGYFLADAGTAAILWGFCLKVCFLQQSAASLFLSLLAVIFGYGTFLESGALIRYGSLFPGIAFSSVMVSAISACLLVIAVTFINVMITGKRIRTWLETRTVELYTSILLLIFPAVIMFALDRGSFVMPHWDNPLYIFTTFLIGTIPLMFVFVFDLLVHREISETRLQNMQSVLEMYESQTEILMDRNKSILEKHQIAERMQVLQSMAAAGQYEAVELYIRETAGIIGEQGNVAVYTKNTCINALLNYKAMKHPEVSFQCEVNLDNDCGVGNADLGILVMSLLDLCIPLCEKGRLPGQIILKGRKFNASVMIEINHKILHHASDTIEHSVISNIIRKYHGYLSDQEVIVLQTDWT